MLAEVLLRLAESGIALIEDVIVCEGNDVHACIDAQLCCAVSVPSTPFSDITPANVMGVRLCDTAHALMLDHSSAMTS